MPHPQVEPSGHVCIDENVTLALGLQLEPSQRKLVSALFYTQPVSPCSAALTLLQISIINHGREPVDYIATTLPAHRTCSVTSAVRGNYVSNNMKYTNRPAPACEAIAMRPYFREHMIVTKGHPVPPNTTHIGTDSFQNLICRRNADRPALMRFTDYHPVHNSEGFWYNYLLEHVPFRDESELLMHAPDGSYFTEVLARGLVEGDISEFLTDAADAYCLHHMYSTESRTAMIDQLVLQCGTMAESLAEVLGDTSMPDDGPSDDAINTQRQPAVQRLLAIRNEFNDLPPSSALNALQTDFFNVIRSGKKGLFILTGPGGTGKTHLLRTLIHAFRCDNQPFLVSAASGAAAVRVTRTAQTNHACFKIPVRGGLVDLSLANPQHNAIATAQCFILDECSMLTQVMLMMILTRIKGVRRCKSLQELLDTVTIILAGDMYQVRRLGAHRPPTRCQLAHLVL